MQSNRHAGLKELDPCQKKKKKYSERNPRVWFLINYLMHVGLRLTLYAKCIKKISLKSHSVRARHYRANVRVLAQTREARDLLTAFSTWWHSPEGYPYSQTICECSKWNHLRLCISIAAFLSPVSSWDTSSTLVFITIHWLVQAYMPWAYKSLLSPSFQLKHLYLFK